MNAPVTVFLIEDHPVVTEGLIRILEDDSTARVIGHAPTGAEAIEALGSLNPDVIVLDYRLPDMDGVQFLREAAERHIRGEVVVLSAYLDDEIVRSSFTSGARAYVVKDVEPDELKRAIKAAARGETVIDPKVAGKVVSWATRNGDNGARRASLRSHEVRVLRLLSEGKSNQQIADLIGISVNAVKARLQRIYQQLDAPGRAEAVLVALRQGLI